VPLLVSDCLTLRTNLKYTTLIDKGLPDDGTQIEPKHVAADCVSVVFTFQFL